VKDQHSESRASDAASATLTALADFGIEHEVLDCDPELADTAVFCEHYGIPLSISANVIVAAGKSNPRQYAACVLLASTRLDVNKSARQSLGVRESWWASAAEPRALTGMAVGGVTALGLPASLPLWVDSRVMQPDYVILGGGSRSIKIKVAPAVFNLTPNTTIIEGLAVEPG
jgi:prolyl-tRNA editing enzyme YbaK/EbsC (Cys-tRNA(Pro) deacylase)